MDEAAENNLQAFRDMVEARYGKGSLPMSYVYVVEVLGADGGRYLMYDDSGCPLWTALGMLDFMSNNLKQTASLERFFSDDDDEDTTD